MITTARTPLNVWSVSEEAIVLKPRRAWPTGSLPIAGLATVEAGLAAAPVTNPTPDSCASPPMILWSSSGSVSSRFVPPPLRNPKKRRPRRGLFRGRTSAPFRVSSTKKSEVPSEHCAAESTQDVAGDEDQPDSTDLAAEEHQSNHRDHQHRCADARAAKTENPSYENQSASGTDQRDGENAVNAITNRQNGEEDSRHHRDRCEHERDRLLETARFNRPTHCLVPIPKAS